LQCFEEGIVKRRLILAGALCAVPVLLGACAPAPMKARHTLKAGESTLADVQKALGKADAIWTRPDGHQIHSYPRGPEGPDTWMLEIGPDGRYLGMTNALSAKNLARVQPGMSREELLRMLGRPGAEQALRRAGEVVLTWRVRTADGANTTEMFNVHLGPDGRVRRTSRSADPERIMGG